MGDELSVATSLVSVLVGCVMRTCAIIVILGQSLCPHRTAAALRKGELRHQQPRQGRATSYCEGADPVQGTGGRAQRAVCVWG